MIKDEDLENVVIRVNGDAALKEVHLPAKAVEALRYYIMLECEQQVDEMRRSLSKAVAPTRRVLEDWEIG